jgi:hypothetical protein
MAESPKENYVLFSDDIDGSKLQWLKMQLKAIRAGYRVRGIGIKGKPLLEVLFEDFMSAVQILNQTVGSLMIGDYELTWRDLPDNHEAFVGLLSEKLVLVTGQHATVEGLGEVYFYDVPSTSVSAIGCVKQGGRVCVVVIYKGGAMYRYYGTSVTEETWDILFGEVKQATIGDPKASVGASVNRLLKEDKTVKCDKLLTDGPRAGQEAWQRL